MHNHPCSTRQTVRIDYKICTIFISLQITRHNLKKILQPFLNQRGHLRYLGLINNDQWVAIVKTSEIVGSKAANQPSVNKSRSTSRDAPRKLNSMLT